MTLTPLLDRLAAVARQEPAPPVEVAQRVIQRLSSSEAREDKTLVILAIGSAAASLVPLVLAIGTWWAWDEVLAGVFISLALWT